MTAAHVPAICDQAFTREALQQRRVDAGPDASPAHFERCHLDKADLSQLDLHEVDLTGLRLAGARLFKGATLSLGPAAALVAGLGIRVI